MKFGMHTLDDFDIAGKTVLCRVDINEPVDKVANELKSISRIEACVPTIRELSNKGAAVVLLAHQGSDIEYKNFYSTQPHFHVLCNLLNRKVQFIDDVCGPAARQMIKGLKNGEILLLDNVRFCSEEQTLFELNLRLSHEQQAHTEVVRKLSPLADLYICDAFAAAHRSQPTLCGFTQLLPSAMGRLFEKEYSVISELMDNPARPCVYVLGGAKIADAFLVMETILQSGTVDRILTGGLVANILLAANGTRIGNGSLAHIRKSNYLGFIEKAKAILAQYNDVILLPHDSAFLKDGKRVEADFANMPSEACVLDIGQKTARDYSQVLLEAKTVFVNGPMGVFEQSETEYGTKTVWGALRDTDAYTVLGGGDSISAAGKYGIEKEISCISTGGGALIRFLAGEELPVVKALRYAADVFPVALEKKQ